MPGPTVTNFGAVGGELIDNQHVGANKVRFWRIIEKISTSAVASVTLTKKIPANSIVMYAEMNFDTAITLVTGTEVGLGVSGDADAFLESTTTVTKNTSVKGSVIDAENYFAAETSVIISPTNGSGTAAGTLAGTITVQLFGFSIDEITDAP